MTSETTSAQNPMGRVMGLRDFRLLFSGATTSLLGDQFTLIATPWLVLQLTNDPMALGTVLALEGIPRALFMLLGGAITDRISPPPCHADRKRHPLLLDCHDGLYGFHWSSPDLDDLPVWSGVWNCRRFRHPG